MLYLKYSFLFVLFILQFYKPVSSITQKFAVCPEWNSTVVQCSDCQWCPDGSRCLACAPTSVSIIDPIHNYDY